jgi:hypothetical protein
MNIRTKPRPHETVCIGGKTKWRLDALCLLGRRSRTATIDILMDEYLKGKPGLRDAVEERRNDPKPIQLRNRYPDIEEPANENTPDQGEPWSDAERNTL